MFYYGYHFWGMHLIWWFFWLFFIFAMFGWYEPVSRKRLKKDSPLNILQRRLASGEITNEEYHEKKRLIENTKPK